MSGPEGKSEHPHRRRLERLAGMVGGDEGFYVLALHSFVEAYAGERVPEAVMEKAKFSELVVALGRDLIRRGVADNAIQALRRIESEHWRTHKVRHGFAELGREDATAATHNFLVVCEACGINDPALAELRQCLRYWAEKVTPLERTKELERLRTHAVLEARERESLLARLADYEATKAELDHLDGQIALIRREAEQAKARAVSKDERLDKTREEMNRLRLERAELIKRMAQYERLERYVQYLDQFSYYTRTRRDYESSIMALTPEQKAVVQAMDLGHDFLVKGAAGTGKTLVLLHALAKAHQENAEDLDLSPHGALVLLTYTTTLVKYDRYLAEIMGRESGPEAISTADAYIQGKLKLVEPDVNVEFGLAKDFCRRRASAGGGVDFLNADELQLEIEDLLLGMGITREEYVDNRVVRRGMRQPLSGAQRTAVWAVRDEFVESMERTRVYSRSYARLKLIGHLERGGEAAASLRDADLIFVDESQDLNTVDLKCLKLLARRAVIMAGDADQSLYGVGSPYARAGLDISGRTRILHTNFRNTRTIHDLAERYRRSAGDGRHDSSTAPVAFREGPLPELVTAAGSEELLQALLGRVELFLKTLSYDPENVCVLCPTKEEINRVGKALRTRGLEAANVRDPEFSFETRGTIRLCTLHSSKGLDFPVVLLYLPKLPPVGQYDEKSTDKLQRNLVYVGMTRAMDNLTVFTAPEPTEAALRDLVSAWVLPGDYQITRTS